MPAAVRAQFEQLRRHFVAGLAARWAELRATDDASRQAQLLHRLAGAAGSYGFAALGRCASDAEAIALSRPGPALAAALDDLGRQIIDARHRFEEAP